MESKISWSTKISFGKYGPKKGDNQTLLNVLIIDKPYLRYCYENNLHEKYSELKWLFENIKQHEFDRIMES